MREEKEFEEPDGREKEEKANRTENSCSILNRCGDLLLRHSLMQFVGTRLPTVSCRCFCMLKGDRTPKIEETKESGMSKQETTNQVTTFIARGKLRIRGSLKK